MILSLLANRIYTQINNEIQKFSKIGTEYKDQDPVWNMVVKGNKSPILKPYV
jgi:hypothetical protein